MKICPIAIAVGCRKCPIFAVCPVKGVIGDYRKDDDAPAKAASVQPNTASVRPKTASARPKAAKRRTKHRR